MILVKEVEAGCYRRGIPGLSSLTLIMSSKHICLFLGMEIPSVFSKAIFYTNILEKIV